MHAEAVMHFGLCSDGSVFVRTPSGDAVFDSWSAAKRYLRDVFEAEIRSIETCLRTRNADPFRATLEMVV